MYPSCKNGKSAGLNLKIRSQRVLSLEHGFVNYKDNQYAAGDFDWVLVCFIQ